MDSVTIQRDKLIPEGWRDLRLEAIHPDWSHLRNNRPLLKLYLVDVDSGKMMISSHIDDEASALLIKEAFKANSRDEAKGKVATLLVYHEQGPTGKYYAAINWRADKTIS